IEIDLAGDQTTIGLLADKVYEVTEIVPAEIEETPRIGMIWRQEYISCVGKRGDDFIIVLDIAAIFSSALRDRKDTPSSRNAA
ncbi:chemotaxis protein CheW, partial [Klebsiella aerogenes]|uniref:chemotaxis protein CheW n=1 Tax=Klebsiella aerogenes TaxID=548 RepID=UPI001953B049